MWSMTASAALDVAHNLRWSSKLGTVEASQIRGFWNAKIRKFEVWNLETFTFSKFRRRWGLKLRLLRASRWEKSKSSRFRAWKFRNFQILKFWNCKFQCFETTKIRIVECWKFEFPKRRRFESSKLRICETSKVRNSENHKLRSWGASEPLPLRGAETTKFQNFGVSKPGSFEISKHQIREGPRLRKF